MIIWIAERAVSFRGVDQAYEQALLDEALAGDEQALTELMDRSQSVVISALRDAGIGEEELEDLIQETLYQVFVSLPRFRRHCRLSTWIYQIARHTALTHLRKRRHALPTVSLMSFEDDDERPSPVEQIPSGDDPEKDLEREMVRRAVERLRPEYRDAVKLHYFEGYSLAEIAEAMEVPLGTVKTYLHRARAELRKMLGGGEDE